jgi:antitoxin YefM
MIIAKQMEIRDNIKTYFDTAYEGEVIVVPRKNGRNIVIISENEYTRLNKSHLTSYYSMLSPSNNDTIKEDNLKKLDEISTLKSGWNGSDAKPLPAGLIKKVRALIKALTIQPEIFPTSLETIQLEFDNSRHDHMEIEVSLSGDAEVFIAPYDDNEYSETIRATAATINERVIAFYG